MAQGGGAMAGTDRRRRGHGPGRGRTGLRHLGGRDPLRDPARGRHHGRARHGHGLDPVREPLVRGAVRHRPIPARRLGHADPGELDHRPGPLRRSRDLGRVLLLLDRRHAERQHRLLLRPARVHDPRQQPQPAAPLALARGPDRHRRGARLRLVDQRPADAGAELPGAAAAGSRAAAREAPTRADTLRASARWRTIGVRMGSCR